jgi:sec-independent protein translocase protein TatA
MGPGGISVWQLLIVLAIALMVFGTNKLKNIGGDLGGAIKGFRKAMEQEESAPSRPADPVGRIAEQKPEDASTAQTEAEKRA